MHWRWKLENVLCRRLVRSIESPVQVILQLVELPHLPPRIQGPLPGSDRYRVPVEVLCVLQEEVTHHEDHDKRGHDQVEGGHRPKPLLQDGHVAQKVPFYGELLVEHEVEDAPIQVPLQGLREHDLVPEARDGVVQRKHVFVQHADKVILFPHNAVHYVVRAEVSRDAQPSVLLHSHEPGNELWPGDSLQLSIAHPELVVDEVLHVDELLHVVHDLKESEHEVRGEYGEVQHNHHLPKKDVLQGRGVEDDPPHVAVIVPSAGMYRAPVHEKEQKAAEENGERQRQQVEHPRQ
mmetsp:Transcript_2717/g.10028  ORF Transcript_2717/g.10028 Transcript_2717/m.10028 type:complete len:292 (-) Transcript_2717:188-1063(-)